MFLSNQWFYQQHVSSPLHVYYSATCVYDICHNTTCSHVCVRHYIPYHYMYNVILSHMCMAYVLTTTCIYSAYMCVRHMPYHYMYSAACTYSTCHTTTCIYSATCTAHATPLHAYIQPHVQHMPLHYMYSATWFQSQPYGHLAGTFPGSSPTLVKFETSTTP